jgi:hypothetical protein
VFFTLLVVLPTRLGHKRLLTSHAFKYLVSFLVDSHTRAIPLFLLFVTGGVIDVNLLPFLFRILESDSYWSNLFGLRWWGRLARFLLGKSKLMGFITRVSVLHKVDELLTSAG